MTRDYPRQGPWRDAMKRVADAVAAALPRTAYDLGLWLLSFTIVALALVVLFALVG